MTLGSYIVQTRPIGPEWLISVLYIWNRRCRCLNIIDMLNHTSVLAYTEALAFFIVL